MALNFIVHEPILMRNQDVHEPDVDRLEAETVAPVVRQLLKLKQERVLLRARSDKSWRELVIIR